MSELILVIGNYNLSSWSLRPWLLLTELGIGFRTVRVELGSPLEKTPEVKAEIRRHSPSGRVPVLDHDGLKIWDSLAICEYVAETFPDKQAWPADKAARAHARSISAEMHSGFSDMRHCMTMDIRSSLPMADVPRPVAEDVARIQHIWRECRTRFGGGGPFLFGRFSIADAMFAPVVSRFTTYAVAIDDIGKAYMDTMWALPAMQTWLERARQEA